MSRSRRNIDPRNEIGPDVAPTFFKGFFWAIVLIPFLPVILPCVLIWYLGQMVNIVTRKK